MRDIYIIAYGSKSIASNLINLPLFKRMSLISTLFLAALGALTFQIFYFSPIDPVLLEIPPSLFSTLSTKNNQLQVKKSLMNTCCMML